MSNSLEILVADCGHISGARRIEACLEDAQDILLLVACDRHDGHSALRKNDLRKLQGDAFFGFSHFSSPVGVDNHRMTEAGGVHNVAGGGGA